MIAGCGKAKTDTTTTKTTDTRKKTEVKVGLSTDAALKSLSSTAVSGLKKIQKEYTIEPVILESKDKSAYIKNLTALTGKCDLTFGVGYIMQQPVTSAAKANPNKKFAILDYVIDLPNVVSVTFKANEGSFLVGVIAGKATKTNKVGFIGGEDIPLIESYEAGFIAGVMSVNPIAAADLVNRKNTIYTGKFDDASAGKAAAKSLYSSGCDVIYHASRSCGLGLLDAAKELRDTGKDVWAIGSDQDQAVTVPKDAGAILSSSVKTADTALYQVTKSLIDGDLKGGTVLTFGIREKGVGIAPTKNSKAPAGIYDLADKYKQLIIDGNIVVPETLNEAKTFKPTAID